MPRLSASCPLYVQTGTNAQRRGQATAQWLAFMQQMNEAEQAMFEILKRYTAEKRRGLWNRLMLSMIKRRSSREAACIVRLSLLEPVVQWRNEGRV